MTPAVVEGLNIYMLARRLAAARDQAGLTPTALALRCGLSLPHLNALERGKVSAVRGETLVRLARALGCSLDYLCGLTDDQTPPKRPRPRKAAPVA